MPNMKIIGITGGIGTGKSTVARRLGELGAKVIDADVVGREAMKPGTPLWHKVVGVFGEDILGPDSTIDRTKLGRRVFSDPVARETLNQIMHPAMYEIVRQKIEDYREQGVAVVALDAALLIKAEWTDLVDEVWVTVAPEETVIKRLGQRRGLSREEALARIRSQLPPEERVRQADVVVNTDCTLEQVRARVEGLWKRLEFDTRRE